MSDSQLKVHPKIFRLVLNLMFRDESREVFCPSQYLVQNVGIDKTWLEEFLIANDPESKLTHVEHSTTGTDTYDHTALLLVWESKAWALASERKAKRDAEQEVFRGKRDSQVAAIHKLAELYRKKSGGVFEYAACCNIIMSVIESQSVAALRAFGITPEEFSDEEFLSIPTGLKITYIDGVATAVS